MSELNFVLKTIINAPLMGVGIFLHIDSLQAGAVVESPPANGSNTVWNGDVSQAGAAFESILVNGSNAIGNGDAG